MADGYDIVIVGAGSAGVPLAVRLAANHDRRVALIEAGPHYPQIGDYPNPLRHAGLITAALPGHPNNWAFPVTLTDEGMAFSIPRGLVVGGSSAINGTIFERATTSDLQEWVDAGNTEWSYESVLPFFRKSETDLDFDNPTHGTAGPIRVFRPSPEQWAPTDHAFVAACQAAGFENDPDMNAPDSRGVGALAMNAIEGVRQNVAHCYLEPALPAHPNLVLLPNRFATRVVFDGNRAVGVEVMHEGERTVVYGDEIVLSAGAIKSPHLLMLSGIGPADELRQHGIEVVHDSPGVGGNVSDHAVVNLAVSVPRLAKIDPTKYPLMQVGAHYSAPGSSVDGDLFTFPTSYPHNVAVLHGVPLLHRAKMGLKSMRALSVRRVLAEARHGSNITISTCLMKPLARGSIRLASGDPATYPVVNFRYLSEPEDERRLREGVRLMASLVSESEAYRELGAELAGPSGDAIRSDESLKAYVRHALASCIHMAGSCKMGPDSDGDAVVDQYCRVKGVDRLRVVDTSIWPQTLRRCTNATAVMTGERAAAFLGE
jgi:choline dehydrogenase